LSHYSTIQTEMTDEDVLLAALREQGVEAEVHDEPVEMLDWYGKPTGRAHVIAKTGTKTGYGFRRTENGFVEVSDAYDLDRTNFNRAWRGKVRQSYALLAGEKAAKRKGWRSERVAQKDGSVKLVCRAGWR
jgi:hypothetical protein